MARYIYKPLTFYTDPNNKFAMQEFLELYKDSLTSGEMLIDLTEYDIYIANNGIEYPIPIIKTLREAVIKWIESDNNPIKLLSLLNQGKDDKKNYNTIQAKIEKINKLMESIKTSQKLLKDEIDDSLNKLMRTEREVQYFYTNLSEYLIGYSRELTSLERDIGKIISLTIYKCIEYYEKLILLYEKLSNLNNDEISTLYTENILDNFINMKELINMGVECNAKLDKSFIDENTVPEYTIELSVTKNSNEEISGEDTTMKYMNNIFDKESNIDFNYEKPSDGISNGTYKIIINKPEEKKSKNENIEEVK